MHNMDENTGIDDTDICHECGEQEEGISHCHICDLPTCSYCGELINDTYWLCLECVKKSMEAL